MHRRFAEILVTAYVVHVRVLAMRIEVCFLVQRLGLLSAEVCMVGGLYLQSVRRRPALGHPFAELDACSKWLEEREVAPVTIGLLASGSRGQSRCVIVMHVRAEASCTTSFGAARAFDGSL